MSLGVRARWHKSWGDGVGVVATCCPWGCEKGSESNLQKRRERGEAVTSIAVRVLSAHAPINAQPGSSPDGGQSIMAHHMQITRRNHPKDVWSREEEGGGDAWWLSQWQEESNTENIVICKVNRASLRQVETVKPIQYHFLFFGGFRPWFVGCRLHWRLIYHPINSEL